jgi:hypothetical protein
MDNLLSLLSRIPTMMALFAVTPSSNIEIRVVKNWHGQNAFNIIASAFWATNKIPLC